MREGKRPLPAKGARRCDFLTGMNQASREELVEAGGEEVSHARVAREERRQARAHAGKLPLKPLVDVVKAYGVGEEELLELGKEAPAATAEAAREAAEARTGQGRGWR